MGVERTRAVMPSARHMKCPAVLALTLFALAACRFESVRGRVTDVRGQALPGVAVTIEDTGDQTLTDALGAYELRHGEGPVALVFDKTGYTAGRLEARLPGDRSVILRDVALWPLPPEKGVYLCEDHRYRPVPAAAPEQFVTADGEVLFALVREPDVATEDPRPMVIGHRMPPYDARVTRVAVETVRLIDAGGKSYERDLWVPERRVSAYPEVIDPPDKLLIRFALEDPLEPGVYAVNWGALEGYAVTDEHAYAFRVAAPEAADGPDDSEEGEDDGGEGASD